MKNKLKSHVNLPQMKGKNGVNDDKAETKLKDF